MSAVRYEQATRTYEGTDVAAVDELNLDIGDGELLVLVGPSGSGKSTALRMLAGLEPLDAGAIYIGDRDVSNVRPRDRDIAMVFQSLTSTASPSICPAGNASVSRWGGQSSGSRRST
jgi:multiple sugar transport system ATP-binding protein